MKPRIKIRRSDKIKTRYRFVILNHETFQELFSLSLSSLNVWVSLSTIAIALIFITASAIIYTPLKYFIPGFGDYNHKSQIIGLSFRMDSLESNLVARRKMLDNLIFILEEKSDSLSSPVSSKLPESHVDQNIDRRPEADEELRRLVEKEENYSLRNPGNETSELLARLKQLYFVKPVSGYVTEKWNAEKGHYGIDIAAPDGEAVKAAYDGTVIAAFWDVETGYNLVLQHNDNLITVYKHCGKLLKKNGTFVKSGEAIALVGSTGELSSGPHLHFELWKNGMSLDPAQLIAL